ncbi:MAG: hypothetical protein LC777_20415 [Actinobacteria bacterium]|nr:hypothetical protein [Actinomycetota bacterium]
MSAQEQSSKGSSTVLAGAGVLMVLCCAVGPAVVGALAGSVVGGLVGVVVACVAAAGLGLALYWHRDKRGRC